MGGFYGVQMKTEKRCLEGGVGSNRSRCGAMADFYK
jgi:hypothetical protein